MQCIALLFFPKPFDHKNTTKLLKSMQIIVNIVNKIVTEKRSCKCVVLNVEREVERF